MTDHSIPSNGGSNHTLPSPKSQPQGASSDMSSAAILRGLEIVDELRELADDLRNAKRWGGWITIRSETDDIPTTAKSGYGFIHVPDIKSVRMLNTEGRCELLLDRYFL